MTKRRPRGPVSAEFGRLIKAALTQQNLSARQVAISLTIDETHFSKAISGHRRLTPEKVISLAHLLGISSQKLLRAAGHAAVDKHRVDAAGAIPVPQKGGSVLRVVSDARFFDSALFLWVFSQQPLAGLGMSCEVVHTPWNNVPNAVDAHPNSIGFYNRRARIIHGFNEPKVQYWVDLACYRGYAVIARAERGGQPQTLKKANDYLRRLIAERKLEGKKPTVVTFLGDPGWVFPLPLVEPPMDTERFQFLPVQDPDSALDGFIRGKGDLFIGGLPQRLKARESGCIEILNAELNPLLFSFNSLIYPDAMLETLPNARGWLSAAAGCWFTYMQLLRTESSARDIAIENIPQLVTELVGKEHHITPEGLRVVLPKESSIAGAETEEFEFFPGRPTELVDEVVRIYARILNTVVTFTDRDERLSAAEAANRHTAATLNLSVDAMRYPLVSIS